ncbi:MAG: hypothetical protein Q7R81_00335 [Candidatus Peregrinibacteria bacterium]|nr:hypothetical protein [Candidatus Peregrinibacteria bacterium]
MLLRLPIVALLLLAPALALAHPSGQLFEAKVGELTIDGGCNEIAFYAGLETFCSFGIIEGAGSFDWTLVPHDVLTVTITPKDGESAPIEQSNPGEPEVMTFFSLTFPRAGDYTMNVRFTEGTDVIAEAAFPVTVQGEDQLRFVKRVVSAAVLGILAIITVALTISAIRVRPRS